MYSPVRNTNLPVQFATRRPFLTSPCRYFFTRERLPKTNTWTTTPVGNPGVNREGGQEDICNFPTAFQWQSNGRGISLWYAPLPTYL